MLKDWLGHLRKLHDYAEEMNTNTSNPTFAAFLMFLSLVWIDFPNLSEKDLSFKTFGRVIDQFRYIKIQSKTIDLITRLWGIKTKFVEFIP